MDIDQARRIATAHDNFDGALANLRNAAAMPTDDPRAKELLEKAGDSYEGAYRELHEMQSVGSWPSLEAVPKVPNDPIFKLGDVVLVDEGPRGPQRITKVEPGMIPSVNADATIGEEPGYWYNVEPEGGGAPYRAVEYNLMLVKNAEPPSQPAGTAPGAEEPKGEPSPVQDDAEPPAAA